MPYITPDVAEVLGLHLERVDGTKSSLKVYANLYPRFKNNKTRQGIPCSTKVPSSVKKARTNKAYRDKINNMSEEEKKQFRDKCIARAVRNYEKKKAIPKTAEQKAHDKELKRRRDVKRKAATTEEDIAAEKAKISTKNKQAYNRKKARQAAATAAEMSDHDQQQQASSSSGRSRQRR